MLLEQENLANKTREFLSRWGLKGKYVAKACDIGEKTFSRFINHKLALSEKQLGRLYEYIEEYEQRNSA